MRNAILIIGLLILISAVAVGWQIASVELDNIELHDDLRDVAAQKGANIGLTSSTKTDEQVREEVIATAAEHGLHLQPDQVTLQRFAEGRAVRYDVSVDYTAHVNLFLYSFDLHFIQTSAK